MSDDRDQMLDVLALLRPDGTPVHSCYHPNGDSFFVCDCGVEGDDFWRHNDAMKLDALEGAGYEITASGAVEGTP